MPVISEKIVNVCFYPTELIPLNPHDFIESVGKKISDLANKKVRVQWKEKGQVQKSSQCQFHRSPIKGQNTIALTVILPKIVGFTPPSNGSIPIGKWVTVPNSPILQNVYLSFSKEALESLQKTGDRSVPFKIDLMELHLIEKPLRGLFQGMNTDLEDE